ncbi:MAG: hypothetical protein R3Y24_02890 [Eubacteriales bacterium]
MKIISDEHISFISELERNIFCLSNEQISFPNIAQRYSVTVEEIHKIYYAVLNKIEILTKRNFSEPVVYKFECTDIENFISRMGLSKMTKINRELLVLSIYYAKEYPHKLDNLLGDFYPTISNRTGRSVNSVKSRLKDIYSDSFYLPECESKLFFRQAGLWNVRDARMSRLLRATVNCINWDNQGGVYNKKTKK